MLHLAEELIGPTGFGGIAGLLRADSADLQRIKGLGPAKRAELMAVLELARRAMAEPLIERNVMDSPDTVKQFLQLQLGARRHEVFAAMFLDPQLRLIAVEELFRGTLNQSSVYPREVVLRALHHGCTAMILAHNHPSGNIEPSRSDIQLTQTLQSALALIDVRVIDHFVVTTGRSLSMAEEGFI
ncbi:hypothetical protein SDC9_113685 [bioreactor metagenome]|uniref:MPN domain-containing protein n=1 Tax=bioreactor metagenome TaxID=1076179 RepID=A0A645BYJ2_9ZZZZ